MSFPVIYWVDAKVPFQVHILFYFILYIYSCFAFVCTYAPFFFVLVMCPWMPEEALDVIGLEIYSAMWILKIELRALEEQYYLVSTL